VFRFFAVLYTVAYYATLNNLLVVCKIIERHALDRRRVRLNMYLYYLVLYIIFVVIYATSNMPYTRGDRRRNCRRDRRCDRLLRRSPRVYTTVICYISQI